MLKTITQPLHPLRLPPPDSFHNQTVLVTGANTGVGLETARHALSLGASKIIIGVRSVEKGEKARDDILSTIPTTASTRSIEVWNLDLSSFQNVMAFVQRMREYVERPGNRLDTAIMNAGIATGDWNVSTDGWEMSVQVNGLSTALLSLELLPVLIFSSSSTSSVKRTTSEQPRKPHLVIVSSDIHQTASVPQRTAPNILAALNDKDQWSKAQAKNVVERYAVSKLFSQWTNIEIAKLVPIDPLTGLKKVIVTSPTPGFTNSELLSRDESAPWLLRLVQALFARTPAHGAMAVVDAAVREDGHGKWLENQKLTDPGYIVSSPEGQKMREQAWGEILDVLKRVDPDLQLSCS